jgi:hypothetical protein
VALALLAHRAAKVPGGGASHLLGEDMIISLNAAASQSLLDIKMMAEGLRDVQDVNLLEETRSQLLKTVSTLQSTLAQIQDEIQTSERCKRIAEDEVRRLQKLLDEQQILNRDKTAKLVEQLVPFPDGAAAGSRGIERQRAG